MVAITPDSALADAASDGRKPLSVASLGSLLGEVLRRRRSRPQAASVGDQMPDGIFFHRTPPAPTVPGQPPAPPKARPVLDAIKAALTSFIGTAGPTLAPMLLQLITGMLGKWTAGAGVTPPVVAKSVELARTEQGVALASASDDALAGAVCAKYQQLAGTMHVESFNPAFSFGVNILQEILSLLGPDFESTVIGIVEDIFAALEPPKTAA